MKALSLNSNMYKLLSKLPVRARGTLLSLLFITVSILAYSNTHIVVVNHFNALPKLTRAVAGDTIRWVWAAGNNTIIPDALPKGAISFEGVLSASSKVFSYVVTVPGIYHFKSVNHPLLLKGKIVVDSSEQRDTEIHIYPQPFKNNLTIDMGGSTSFKNEVTIEVFDALGQLKYKKSAVKHNINLMDLSGLNPGIYLVSISDGVNKRTYRVVKSQ